MSLVREQNWNRDDQQFAPRIKDDAEITDWYKDKYTKLLGRFKGDVFDCVIRSAYMVEVEYKKNGKEFCAEVMHLICFVRNSMNYLDVSVIARTKKKDKDTGAWGEWSNNSNAINDLMEIVCRQKTDYLESYSYSTDYEDRESYPHFCGTQVKIIAVCAEQKVSSKGKYYDKNQFKVFAPDFHSGWELKMGQKDCLDYQTTINEFGEIYNDFCQENNLPFDYIHQSQNNNPAPAPTQQTTQVNSFTGQQQSDNLDDDLPF